MRNADWNALCARADEILAKPHPLISEPWTPHPHAEALRELFYRPLNARVVLWGGRPFDLQAGSAEDLRREAYIAYVYGPTS
jgi:hypothetical protein